MKYLTRDQLLEALGPTARMGQTIFQQKPETRFPVVAQPNDKNPEEVIAQYEYLPYSWSTKPRAFAFVIPAALYESLPDDPELEANAHISRPASERSSLRAFREGTKKAPASD